MTGELVPKKRKPYRKAPVIPLDELQPGIVAGRLTLLEFALRRKPAGARSRVIKYALCRCSCGTVKEIRLESISQGLSRSCGCANYELHCKDPRERLINYVFTYTKSSAKKRGIIFDLKKSDVEALIFKECSYCGDPPSLSSSICGRDRKYGLSFPKYNGIDRQDSQVGYLVGNVVTCCSPCNTAKLDLSLEEFFQHISKIYHHLNNRTKNV